MSILRGKYFAQKHWVVDYYQSILNVITSISQNRKYFTSTNCEGSRIIFNCEYKGRSVPLYPSLSSKYVTGLKRIIFSREKIVVGQNYCWFRIIYERTVVWNIDVIPFSDLRECYYIDVRKCTLWDFPCSSGLRMLRTGWCR